MIRMNRRMMLGAGGSVGGRPGPLAIGQDKKEAVAAAGQPVTITVSDRGRGPGRVDRPGQAGAARDPLPERLHPHRRRQHRRPAAVPGHLRGDHERAWPWPTAAPAGRPPPALDFDLAQRFEVCFDNPKVKTAKLTMEGRVIGFLRGHKNGIAPTSAGRRRSVAAAGGRVAGHGHAVPLGQRGPEPGDERQGGAGQRGRSRRPGSSCLNQSFHVGRDDAEGRCCRARRPSAEFAPDPAIDPLWISCQGAVPRGQEGGPRASRSPSRWPRKRSRPRRRRRSNP